MHFDPDAFGAAMGELVAEAVLPLKARIAELEKQLAERPDIASAVAREVASAVADLPAPRDGRDCDMDEVRAMVDEAVRAIPAPKDGEPGKDAEPVDEDALAERVLAGVTERALSAVEAAVPKAVKTYMAENPAPKGEKGDPGKDGTSVALEDVSLFLDAAVAKQVLELERRAADAVTRAIDKIPVPKDGKDGKDGIDGVDGKDGIGLESFEAEYVSETNEIVLRAGVGDRVKEARYPAGGIRLIGYWREGVKAQSGEAYSHKGSLWIARSETTAAPMPESRDWVLAARHGRDGERGPAGKDGAPPPPVNLKK